MSRLGLQTMVTLCRAVGFPDIPMALSIAMAESGFDPAAVNTTGNTPPSRDRGLFQINDHWHPEVPDAVAFDAAGNTREAFRISNGGTYWSPWSTFTNGAYKRYYAQFQQEVDVAHAPFATWRGPIPNMSSGGMSHPVRGVVLHIMEGTLDGTDGWFHDPAAKASSHFGVGKDGRIFQWVDTSDKAWTEVAGNPDWISIENEGHSGDSLTDAQLQACAEIVRWVFGSNGVPFVEANSPGDRGLGTHAMGGAAWGGHTSCPGAPITAQRQQILELAQGDEPVTDAEIEKIAQRVRALLFDPQSGEAPLMEHAVDKQLNEHGLAKSPETFPAAWANDIVDRSKSVQ